MVSNYPAKFSGHRHCGSREYHGFSLLRGTDIARPGDQRVMWFYGGELLMVSHHPTMVIAVAARDLARPPDHRIK